MWHGACNINFAGPNFDHVRSVGTSGDAAGAIDDLEQSDIIAY